ncbi:o-succinylbenzoate synthase [Synechococcus sp. M16CYN]|uniref:o-succinylbenzoate synthase n=1 Tax=Synechococcus sp. M16CYN TaxID=3103139 RepID=UPI00333EB7EE
MMLRLQVRSFRFALMQSLRTAAGVFSERRGWLLRVQDDNGMVGWGEVAPLQAEQWTLCRGLLLALPNRLSLSQFAGLIIEGPGAIGFGCGAALAELDGVVGGDASQSWKAAPNSAQLLPAGEQMLMAVDRVLDQTSSSQVLTLKWKVATEPAALEQQWLRQLLDRLPSNARLRLDANGGWDRSTAESWMKALRQEPRFDWLEQPLAVNDHAGLEQLARLGPVALDESLEYRPELRDSWMGWQVRRPVVDGDPRPLLQELQNQVPYRMVSTAFETGIGRRWLHHLAALQCDGPTPTAPGLAPGWCPTGPLFSDDPEMVWAGAL